MNEYPLVNEYDFKIIYLVFKQTFLENTKPECIYSFHQNLLNTIKHEI